MVDKDRTEIPGLNGARVLVTGAGGFIGSHLVDALLQQNMTVHALVRNPKRAKWLDATKIDLHTGDLLQPATYRDLLKQVDVVLHCGGTVRARKPSDFNRNNVTACNSLYEACLEHGRHLKSIVHLSSIAASGPSPLDAPIDETASCRPHSDYGHSKLAGEVIALTFSRFLPITILRPPVVYGERDRNLLDYIKLISKGWNVHIGRKPKILSLIYIEDLTRAILHAGARPPESDRVLFITDGECYSWDRVAEAAMEILNVRARRIVLSQTALTALAFLSETFSKFSKHPPLLDRQRVRDIDQGAWTASPKRFFDTYGFRPRYDLKEGLTRTIDWYREHRWL
ncbi:putative NAD-dependent epimerase/dehydratase family protein/3-beta hydroxysteroid dehydrogenase/isomerase family protein [Nitrospina gracilis 3/211]|uniref:Putative NAD-dependent epimerase/dehydratase family protein/3-beta hydroxysteroid dehydrogenase/isomerase family protein n=1 Tax=Nitrospina gracilis (strain 3/211) TaxID=1266370 RepID=M1Z2X1_NITG3|nr:MULTISPECIES: NAD(P)-dependent oxidoreductase [Nitrospina]MCF8724809.1 nucleoside-diphosphate-sugar epimerase [Nitrospina sp. Nb-3]CCQ92084.1 putative NAD-dependent epimerase/dehydratase family protein/3-beta hydroxysteroid dehydrogenase/isomerase family protein [Nitrospina gracilis 3/211]